MGAAPDLIVCSASNEYNNQNYEKKGGKIPVLIQFIILFVASNRVNDIALMISSQVSEMVRIFLILIDEESYRSSTVNLNAVRILSSISTSTNSGMHITS